MSYIELPGDCTPIPTDTWAGPSIPAMTDALLRDDQLAADAAFKTWADVTGYVAEIQTFPSADADKLIRMGRPRLAALLISHGLLSDKPMITDTLVV